MSVLRRDGGERRAAIEALPGRDMERERAVCRGTEGRLEFHALDHEQGLVLAHLLPLGRSEEHTSELQSLMRISYAVFCLKKKKHHDHTRTQHVSTSVTNSKP